MASYAISRTDGRCTRNQISSVRLTGLRPLTFNQVNVDSTSIRPTKDTSIIWVAKADGFSTRSVKPFSRGSSSTLQSPTIYVWHGMLLPEGLIASRRIRFKSVARRQFKSLWPTPERRPTNNGCRARWDGCGSTPRDRAGSIPEASTISL